MGDLPARVAAANAELLRGPAAWIHCDAHYDNALWRSADEAVVIDWSNAKAGPPSYDVAKAMFEGALREGERRWRPDSDRAAELVETYIEAVVEAGVAREEAASVREGVRLAAVPIAAEYIAWEGDAEGPGSEREAAVRLAALESSIEWLALLGVLG